MSASQKHAWFNLAVISLTLITVVALYPTLGWKAQAAIGMCGVLGFGPFFFRRRREKTVMDERDFQIQRRSALLGYSIFWVVFVLAAACLSPLWYGQSGSVPVLVVQMSVFYAMLLFVGVTSVATLIQYGRA